MQQVPVRAFSYDRLGNLLTADESDLRGQLDLSPVINSMQAFEIVGDRETKRYQFSREMREPARFEVGDIQGWEFRPVDGYGRFVSGPKLVIFND